MGSREPQKQLWSYRVNLDKRVRSDHPLRELNDVLKLDFVRQEVAKFYGIKGNVSEDPAVIMKMMLLLFLDDVRSERELMRIIPERNRQGQRKTWPRDSRSERTSKPPIFAVPAIRMRRDSADSVTRTPSANVSVRFARGRSLGFRHEGLTRRRANFVKSFIARGKRSR